MHTSPAMNDTLDDDKVNPTHNKDDARLKQCDELTQGGREDVSHFLLLTVIIEFVLIHLHQSDFITQYKPYLCLPPDCDTAFTMNRERSHRCCRDSLLQYVLFQLRVTSSTVELN